ncbi:glycosyltransferase [Actinokineospora iranica]|uniref:Glycosyltransferase involved in cell wall bisynthesis n=1 Tax=Actinokineospora iranica TaxID=1271860 RepID=A0A1G6XDL1_9PSEU|nr:glycosyltransferase [Actinokineospora iranica]SDD75863.1 Glycosyltransferase involved in cell wall bisynthesis [Actinokineospora iranica]
MRVLQVISEMGTGGAEALVVEMVRRGADFGWESAVASGGGHRAEQVRAAGVPTFDVPVAARTAVGVLRATAATRRALRRFEPDVVVAHNVSATAVSRLAMAVAGRRPLVTVFHGVAESDYPGTARVLTHAADRVVAVAAVTASRLRAAGLSKPDITVIRNGVTPAPAESDQASTRAALGVAPEVPVALCLARLEPQKRHDVLLDAWARLDGDAVLLVAGDGSLREPLEQRCAVLGLGERVRFLGDRGDVPALLAAADITVLTSDWEGMPVAVLESLAAERPVVATDVDGVREVLERGGGTLVPRRDPAAVAAAVRALLFDADARRAAAAAGLAVVRADHDPHTLMKSYDELLRAAVAGRSR